MCAIAELIIDLLIKYQCVEFFILYFFKKHTHAINGFSNAKPLLPSIYINLFIVAMLLQIATAPSFQLHSYSLDDNQGIWENCTIRIKSCYVSFQFNQKSTTSHNNNNNNKTVQYKYLLLL